MSGEELHERLRRQMLKHGLVDDPRLKDLFTEVSQDYAAADRERGLLERSLDLSSSELLEAQRDLRSITQTSANIYFWLREDGTIRTVRTIADECLWCAPSMLVGKRIQDVPEAGVAACFERAIRGATDRGESSSFEYALNVGGGLADFEARVLPLREGGALAIVGDIGQRRREEVEEFREMAKGVNEILYLMDARSRRLLFVNDAFERVWGLPVAEIYANPGALIDLVHEDDREYMRRGLAESKGDYRGEYRIVRPDGEIRWLMDQGYALRDATGTAYRIKGVARDVTAIKRREASIAAENQSLAKQVQEGRERLRQMQKMEALGRLAGGISHDFNNLLVVILSYAEFAHESASDPQLRDDIEQINEAAERGADLTKQLLAFSRRQVLEPQVLSLNDVLLRSRPLIERLVTESMVLSYELDHTLPPIYVDGSQVEQIVMNLVVNARDAVVDARDSGEGRITVLTRIANELDEESLADTHLADEVTVVLEVRDTGTGIPPAIRDAIFDPFFTTKPDGKGTGLGLATVFGIVSQSGGHLDVTSKPGDTGFRVYLPAHRGAATSIAPDPGPTETRSDARIMVVEDDPVVRAVAVRVLERAGYEVTAARHGLHALELLHSGAADVDLVLSDMVMPEMGGRELAEKVRVRHPHVRMLFMSGYTDDDDFRQGLAHGVERVLDKPFTPETLRRRVSEMLSHPVAT